MYNIYISENNSERLRPRCKKGLKKGMDVSPLAIWVHNLLAISTLIFLKNIMILLFNYLFYITMTYNTLRYLEKERIITSTSTKILLKNQLIFL